MNSPWRNLSNLSKNYLTYSTSLFLITKAPLVPDEGARGWGGWEGTRSLALHWEGGRQTKPKLDPTWQPHNEWRVVFPKSTHTAVLPRGIVNSCRKHYSTKTHVSPTAAPAHPPTGSRAGLLFLSRCCEFSSDRSSAAVLGAKGATTCPHVKSGGPFPQSMNKGTTGENPNSLKWKHGGLHHYLTSIEVMKTNTVFPPSQPLLVGRQTWDQPWNGGGP